jgi:hypothetical protein
MKINSIDNKEADIRCENDAFRRIKPALQNLGWRYVEKYVTYFEYKDSLTVVITSALKLENEETIIAIIPDGVGIKISKEAIPGTMTFYFRFLNNLFYFLLDNGVTEIYRSLFSNDDNISSWDRKDYEDGIVNIVKDLCFVPLKDCNKAKFDVQQFRDNHIQKEVDNRLLSKSFWSRT